MCDELTKIPKRSFIEAWLTDDRYKLWIYKVPSDDSLYFCSVCNRQFHANQKILRDMRILHIIQLKKKPSHFVIIIMIKNQYKHLNQ